VGKNSFILIVWMSYLFLTSGCTSVNPIVKDYENHFNGFSASQENLIKESSIKQTFHRSYDEVWDSAVYILAQHAVIIELSKESGTITYLSIDGISFGNVFPEDQFYYWEFPFTLLIVKESQEIAVYVYPMTDLYDDKNKKREWWQVIDEGFNQKGRKFINALSTQLSVKGRWQWLRD